LSTFGTRGVGLCGGSVISRSTILTAAHCADATVTEFNIIFGAVNMRNNEPNQQRRTVPFSGWLQHPSYNRNNLHNDIAIIFFRDQPIELNQFVQTIALAAITTDLFVGEPVHVSGFGRYSDDSPNSSDVLRFTVKNVVTNLSCRVRFPTLVIESTICAIGDDQVNNAV
jgi:secreted trypsin-like serine protease